MRTFPDFLKGYRRVKFCLFRCAVWGDCMTSLEVLGDICAVPDGEGRTPTRWGGMPPCIVTAMIEPFVYNSHQSREDAVPLRAWYFEKSAMFCRWSRGRSL